MIRCTTRGQSSGALAGLASCGLDCEVAELEGDKYARAAIAARASMIGTASRLYNGAFGSGAGECPMLPVTMRSFVAVSSPVQAW